jgi:hypothetical protein
LDEVVGTVCREAGRLVGAAEVRVVQYQADGRRELKLRSGAAMGSRGPMSLRVLTTLRH